MSPRKFKEMLARISHNQVENDVFHGMRGVRGMECRVASSKRLRRAGMRVFSPPFCGRDGLSLSIRARGNGIRLVDFAIRLRIRSWALVIR